MRVLLGIASVVDDLGIGGTVIGTLLVKERFQQRNETRFSSQIRASHD